MRGNIPTYFYWEIRTVLQDTPDPAGKKRRGHERNTLVFEMVVAPDY